MPARTPLVHRFPVAGTAIMLTLLGAVSTTVVGPLAAQTAKSPPPIQRHAVVIGIGDYANPLLPELQFAADDARAFADFVRSPAAGWGGVPDSQVKVLLNEAASTAAVREALATLAEEADSGAYILLYVNGIGTPDLENEDDLYFLAHDADPRDITGTGIPMAFINQLVQEAGAFQTVVVTDIAGMDGRATVEGAAGPMASPGAGPVPEDVARRFDKYADDATGGFVAFIARELPDQRPQEGRKWGGGHGVFTYYLIRGLRGEADAPGFGDNDGIVTLGEVLEYTRDRVRRETRNAQIPTISLTTFDRFWPMAAVIDR